MVAQEQDKRALLIAGPTASGKSGVALQLARQFNGTVINADAMQVYAELRVLSARPSLEDERSVPHRLYGQIGAAERFSSGKWLDAASRALGEVWEAGRLPIVVGGTGLYFKMLESGVARVPDIPPEVRSGVEALYRSEGLDGLKARLPEGYEPFGDPQRLMREVEVFEATGRRLRDLQSQNSPSLLAGATVVRACLTLDRVELYPVKR